ncbi:MAG: cytochrome c biogenesis protein CcsA [Betaproteobacteria bacterium]|nr:cytochrome c biogenesis protein CcsA [Betaproteobacteria bacterium]
MIDAQLYFITAALYLLLGIRVLVMQRARGYAAEGQATGEMIVRALILAALIVHGVLLHRALFADERLDLSLGHSLSLIAGVTVAMYWIVSFRYRMGILQPVILWIAALMVLSPLVLPADKQVAYSGLLAFKVHLVVSLMAYGLFVIAALHAILMGVLEQRLHDHDKRISPLGQLPSLVAMDSLLFQMILVGFLLLTATLVSGVFFSEALFGKPFLLNHKVVLSFISWLIYAGLLAGRQFWGVRGRRAARWTLVGFTLLLVAYVGSKFVLEVILHRG